MLAVFFCFFAAPSSEAAASGQILGGSREAPVRIEVFSDFECPSCRELYLNIIRRVLVDYSSRNKVCVIYHEYPLNIHQYSWQASMYAEAAAQLGRDKLLKVYDILFMDQAVWSKNGNIEASLLKALSREDLQKIKKIMQDPGIRTSVQNGIRLAQQRRILSTPTWFIYSGDRQLQKVEGRLAYAGLKQYLESILK